MKNYLIQIIITINIAVYSNCFSQEAASIQLKFRDGITTLQKGSNFDKSVLFDEVKYDLRSLDEYAANDKIVRFLLRNDSSVNSNEITVDQPKKKSVWIAMGLSALVPGSGEFYAKSYIKSAIFFGIEVASWAFVFYFNHKGNVGTDQFQDFARANWDIRRYANWLVNQGFTGSSVINPNEPNLETLRAEVNQCIGDNPTFSHTIPEFWTQDYFEVIGKYQEFQAGWVGVDQVITKDNYQSYHSAIDENYTYMRQKANNYYNNSTTASAVTIINHLLSIADAAWTVSMYNSNIDVKTGFRMDTYLTKYTYQEKMMPTFNIQILF